MTLRTTLASLVILASAVSASAADKHELTAVKKAPAGLAKPIAAKIDPNGYRIVGPKGTVCEVWLLKDLDIKANFKPTLAVKYPFTPGQLIGAIRVPEKTIHKDFRGQEIKPGVYTLRYGQQPEDGNHIGTSELADFLLAIPAKYDTDTKPITGFDPLSEKSAKSAGSTHPAIFSLLPAEKAPKTATLKHDEDTEFWILQIISSGKAAKKAVKVPLRVVAIGVSEG